MDIESQARKAARTEGTATDSDSAEGEVPIGDDSEHSSIDISETTTTTETLRDVNLEDSTTATAIEFVDADLIEPSDISSSQHYLCASDRLQRSAALFLLSAKERFHLAQSALNYVIQQVQQMVSFAIDDIEEVVKKHLRK